tara:strand:- start:719 stop:949 length:231 start_codon:yes stop_codon:yes gene_type:complete
MVDVQTLSNIRAFIAGEASSGANAAIRDRAEELLKIFDELNFTTFQTDYAAANNGLKLRLLGELQAALLAGRVTND